MTYAMSNNGQKNINVNLIFFEISYMKRSYENFA